MTIENMLSDGAVIGAAYGAIQAVAQVLILVLPRHTIAWRVAKYLISGPSRGEVPSGG